MNTTSILPINTATPPLIVGGKNDKRASRRMSQPNPPSFTMTNNLPPQTHITSESHREPSPASSIRATYIHSRPPSYFDPFDQRAPTTIGDLTKLQADVDRDLESWGALAKESVRQPPLFLHRRPRAGRLNAVDSDSVSILTMSTTSTMRYRPRRNAEASPLFLRNSEKGRSFTLVESEQGIKGNDTEDEPRAGTPTKLWNGPSRLRERLGSLIWRRKENAGILDRDRPKTADDVEAHTKSLEKIRRRFNLSANGPSDHLSAELSRHTRGGSDTMAMRSSLSSRRSRQKQVSEDSQSTISTGRLTLRRSRSFAGFRDSTFPDALREVDAVDSEEFDEITREAARVNVNVRKTFSYEQEESD